MNLRLSLYVIAATISVPCSSWAEKSVRWWPEQKAPKGLVTLSLASLKQTEEPGGPLPRERRGFPESLLAQSLVGLTAKAVNEGRLDELIYLEVPGNPNYAQWRKMVQERLHPEDRGTFSVWELVERYKNRGVFDGYIVYRVDRSDGKITISRPGSDESSNVASSLSGPYKALLISEGLVEKAKSLGLKELFDARGKDDDWLFKHEKNRFSRNHLLLQDPLVYHCRSIAIAHDIMTVFGLEEPTEDIYKWLNPPALIFGWNGGEEGEFVKQLSRQGHVISASNWALNEIVFSVGSSAANTVIPFSPETTSPSVSGQRTVSFCLSDGDNLQWMFGGFAFDKRYWASPVHGSYPIGTGLPIADLLEVGFDIYRYLQQAKPASTTPLIMPGYYYPDLLAIDRSLAERKRVLRDLGRRIGYFSQLSGTKLMMFLCMDIDDPKTLEACKIFASEAPSLEGFLVMEYSPYEGGDGKVISISAAGRKIPLISAKFSLWANLSFAGSGTPAKVARLVNGSGAASQWVSVHAWSGFIEDPNPTDTSENGTFNAPNTQSALNIVPWCIRRISPEIKIVSPLQLVRNIQMQKNR